MECLKGWCLEGYGSYYLLWFGGGWGGEDEGLQSEECDYWDVRRRIDTPDGDFFHVDMKYRHFDKSNTANHPDNDTSNDNDDIWWKSTTTTTTSTTEKTKNSSAGTVLILHGLESNSNSTLSLEMAQAYVRA